MVITPIDFWASAVPWEKAMKEADSIWHFLNPLFTPLGVLWRKLQRKMTMKVKPMIVPRMGERISARMIFLRPAQWSSENPAWATAAPRSPPMMAWDDDEGRP